MRTYPDPEALLRRALAPDAAGTEGRDTCLEDDAIAALAEGGRPTQPDLHHLAGCPHCSARLAAVSRLLAEDGVAAEVRRVEGSRAGLRRPVRWLSVVGGVAAAALVVMTLRTTRAPEPEVVLREQPVTLIAAPVPVSPIGAVAEVDALSWRSVPGATQYRITLFTQDGATAWAAGTTDTALTLPPGIRLARNAVYYWKVEARTDWNRWSASEMVEVRIGGPR